MLPSWTSALTYALALGALLGTAQSCTPARPAKKDDGSVAIDFYETWGCCDPPVFSSTIGVLNTCHSSDIRFIALEMNVGQNLFGRSIKLITWSNTDCTGSSTQLDLTNADVCHDLSNTSPFPFQHSYKIQVV